MLSWPTYLPERRWLWDYFCVVRGLGSNGTVNAVNWSILLNRQFNPAAPNRAWCDDISFIRLQDKWYYLALVVDLYSRRIIGSALLLIADADLVCRALRNALETRLRNGRLLFHSDQGAQYKSNKYRGLFWNCGVMQSMSRRGNCLNNSPMERVFRSLKSE